MNRLDMHCNTSQHNFETDNMIAEVAIDHPHGQLYDYLCQKNRNLNIGQLVLVPFGTRQSVGLVVKIKEQSTVDSNRLKFIDEIFYNLKPLNLSWIALVNFAANYYQTSLGEVAITTIPKILRLPISWKKIENFRPIFYKINEKNVACLAELSDFIRGHKKRKLFEQLKRGPLSLIAACKIHQNAKNLCNLWLKKEWIVVENNLGSDAQIVERKKLYSQWPNDGFLREEQIIAIEGIKKCVGFSVSLLFGVTGSGKTEVYLHVIRDCLQRSSTAQVLILVPEINLISQLMKQFSERFQYYGAESVCILHSKMSNVTRAKNWLSVHEGRTKILIGTRLAAMASFNDLQLIIIDEEHESSYKQQEGLRYSARDLCIWRAKKLNIPIILGSASPSLETWYHAKMGHYHRFDLKQKFAMSSMPNIVIIDCNKKNKTDSLSLQNYSISTFLNHAIQKCLEHKKQCLLFLNRRGFSPIFTCSTCDWIANCQQCTAYLVYHRVDSCLRCHHCGQNQKIPIFCPSCRNTDLLSIGYGTQRVEEELKNLFPHNNIIRIDSDTTRQCGAIEDCLNLVHDQAAQIILGTNMISKGHDFQNIGLVGVLNIDAALFSHDFRSTEKIFSQLLQVSGRAGRGNFDSQVIIQTRYPSHPIFSFFSKQDYSKFADHILSERFEAGLPPFTNQAVLRVEGKSLDQAIDFLKSAVTVFNDIKHLLQADVICYHPIPLNMIKKACYYRAQLLVEGKDKKVLQQCLSMWRKKIKSIVCKTRSIKNWMIEVDPLEL